MQARVTSRVQAKSLEALYAVLTMGKDDGGSGAGKSEDGAQNEKEKMKMGTNDQ